MSTSRDISWQIAVTVQHHGIMSQATEEIIECACDKRRQAQGMASISGVFLILETLLEPERIVARFDPEIDNCDEGACILQHFARTTGGEWAAGSIRATSVPCPHDPWRQAIDFAIQGTHLHWEFTIASQSGHLTDWATTFYERLTRFVDLHLKGMFFAPRVYEETLFYYLPRQAAA